MSAFVTISNLSWSKADGTAFFHNLNLNFGPERTGLIGRNGTGKTVLMRLIAGELRPSSGAIQTTGTFGLMRQDIATNPDDTVADLFGARFGLDLLDRAEAGLADIKELAEADWTLSTRLEAALLRCDLDVDPQTSLAALSGGQRTRAGLAALVFAEPDFLLLDEPTNNLDRAGRNAVIELIRGWRGGAIIVSHDRELLEEMDAIVELTTLGATRYGGNYSTYRKHKAIELDAAHRFLADAEKSRADIAQRAQQAAERKARKDSRGQKSRTKGGQPKILMDAAKGRAEMTKGSNARLRESQSRAAEDALANAREKIEILQPLYMDMPTIGLPAGKTVLRLDTVSGGYDPQHPVIRDLSLIVTGPERVAITGPNGSGKTTLLKLITGAIRPQRGSVNLMTPFAFLDQHVSILDPALTLRENFLRLNPQADHNLAHAALARFRFRAGDALRLAKELSGGEKLRAGLACAMGQSPMPELLILDEPTNHLDLDGIEALEAALNAYDGALLIISHDEAFLNNLSVRRHIDLSK